MSWESVALLLGAFLLGLCAGELYTQLFPPRDDDDAGKPGAC